MFLTFTDPFTDLSQKRKTISLYLTTLRRTNSAPPRGGQTYHYGIKRGGIRHRALKRGDDSVHKIVRDDNVVYAFSQASLS